MEAHTGSDLTGSGSELVTHLPVHAGTWSTIDQFPFIEAQPGSKSSSSESGLVCHRPLPP